MNTSTKRRIWVAVLLTLPVVSAASPAEEKLEGNPFRGRELLAEKLCSECHSVWGHGGVLGPDISVAVSGKSLLDLVGDFWNHTPRMIDAMTERGHSWPTLETEEMADLLSYLYYLRLFDEPGDHLPHCQFAGKVGPQSLVDAQTPSDLVGHPNCSDRNPLGKLDPLQSDQCRQVFFVFECQFDSRHILRWAVGEICDSAFLYLSILAIRMSQEDRLVGSSVFGLPFSSLYMHAHQYIAYRRHVKPKMVNCDKNARLHCGRQKPHLTPCHKRCYLVCLNA